MDGWEDRVGMGGLGVHPAITFFPYSFLFLGDSPPVALSLRGRAASAWLTTAPQGLAPGGTGSLEILG